MKKKHWIPGSAVSSPMEVKTGQLRLVRIVGSHRNRCVCERTCSLSEDHMKAVIQSKEWFKESLSSEHNSDLLCTSSMFSGSITSHYFIYNCCTSTTTTVLVLWSTKAFDTTHPIYTYIHTLTAKAAMPTVDQKWTNPIHTSMAQPSETVQSSVTCPRTLGLNLRLNLTTFDLWSTLFIACLTSLSWLVRRLFSFFTFYIHNLKFLRIFSGRNSNSFQRMVYSLGWGLFCISQWTYSVYNILLVRPRAFSAQERFLSAWLSMTRITYFRPSLPHRMEKRKASLNKHSWYCCC